MTPHSVLALLHERGKTGSTPGNRTDDASLALAIEGGGSRGAYSSGMAAELDKLGLLAAIDHVYGASAGALNGAWLLAGQAELGTTGWSDPAVMRTVTNPWRGLRRGPVVDTRHLVHTVYEAAPMDFAAILANPIGFHPLATSGRTGDVVDLRPTLTDQASLQRALRASTGLPVLSGAPVEIGGDLMLDAGLAEAVPYRSALRDGATHVLVLRTRRADELAKAPSGVENAVVTRYLTRQAPGALTAWRSRHRRQSEDDALLAGHAAVLEVRPPPGSPAVSRLSRDMALLGEAVAIGRRAFAEFVDH